MEIALIGLPQSGKTTLLHGLTRGRTEVGSYGGARQEVHAGVARMPDPRLETLTQIFNPDKLVSVEIKYWDVPAGSGMTGDGPVIGGQFLNLIQNADALVHVVRAFEDPAVPHLAGSVDPERDAANMEAELALSDLAILERSGERIEVGLKGAKDQERDTLLREGSLIQRLREGLESSIPVREQQFSPDESRFLSNYRLLTAKPLLTVFNIDEASLPKAAQLKEDLGRPHNGLGVKATTLCAKLEMELCQLSSDDEAEFREAMGLQGSDIDRVARLSYDLLSLVCFFTYVSKEVRAWTVPAKTPAVEAAGKIHSDMERGFIRAEVIAFDDLARCGSVAQCRNQGLLRLKGKTYRVQDGDVITFLFNV